MLLVALIVSGLMFYGFWTATDGNWLYSAVPAGMGLVTLASMLAFRSKSQPRLSAVIKIVSGIFWSIALVMNVLLVIWKVQMPAIIIPNGLVLCMWIVLVYAIGRSKK